MTAGQASETPAAMLQPQCLTCVAYEPGSLDTLRGRCRRGPAGSTGAPGWPAVQATDWCVAYEPPSLATVTMWAHTQPRRWVTRCHCVAFEHLPTADCEICHGSGRAPTVLGFWLMGLAEAVARFLPPDPAGPGGGDA